MAGHSKWANIRHRKERVDAKRGKVFSRLIKEVTVAAKVGGMDAAANPRLRLALEKARAANVPSDNIDRAIKRGGGQLDGVSYVELRYEGYGPGGAAILMDCLTDNKNRTYPEVRNVFYKYGGNLGNDGSVAYLFRRCGQLLLAEIADSSVLMEIAITNDAEDFIEEDGGVEIICSPEALATLLHAVREGGFTPDEADIVMRPDAEIALNDDDSDRLQRLLDALEDLDDTQKIYTNVIIGEGVS